MALVTGLFLMILVANWIGLLPGVGTIGIITEEHGEEAAHARSCAPPART